MSYNAQQRQSLLKLARDAINYGLSHESSRLPVAVDAYETQLQQPRASFVTLHMNQRLRGCIGSLQPRWSLVEDVAHNAHAAAFSDPRFAPLNRKELALIEISISVLSEPKPLCFHNEQNLLDQLRPGEDGLILTCGSQRGTFFPSVWSQLPQPADFLNQLKLKAGLPADYWSDQLQVSRYTTESFSDS